MNDIFVVSLNNSNQLCLIDEEDRIEVLQHKWNIDKEGYIYITAYRTLTLHRFVLDYFGRKHIHHKLGLKWDNRKSQLQKINQSQHHFLHGEKKRGKHELKSRWVTRTFLNKFKIAMRKKGKLYCAGTFNTEIEAALVANIHARALWGENAYQNIA